MSIHQTVLARDFIDGCMVHTFRLGTKHQSEIILSIQPAYSEGKVHKSPNDP
jgi:hypothetical protein